MAAAAAVLRIMTVAHKAVTAWMSASCKMFTETRGNRPWEPRCQDMLLSGEEESATEGKHKHSWITFSTWLKILFVFRLMPVLTWALQPREACEGHSVCTAAKNVPSTSLGNKMALRSASTHAGNCAGLLEFLRGGWVVAIIQLI